MIRLLNLPLPLDYSAETLRAAAAKRLRIRPAELTHCVLVRRSIDARDKRDVHFVATVEAACPGEDALLKKMKAGTAEKVLPRPALLLQKPKLPHPPVVVGAGPAGLFAALILARAGVNPILIERGRPVHERTADVARLKTQGILDPESNVLFGEGGAGAFSDGKLTTGTKSPHQRLVLETFAAHGAPADILIQQKPHIGTDLLVDVIAGIRQEIIQLGGQILFSTRMDRLILQGDSLQGLVVQDTADEREIWTHHVILALGHSARDTIQTLYRQGLPMTQKPFAMGVRIEHHQAMIDLRQYGAFAGHPRLGAAEYKLVHHTRDGRGVYSFCMCPGGEVINASSQPEGLNVNGMSHHARDGQNSNAALLVGIRPEDFGDGHPLAGYVLQRALEKKAFTAGGGGFFAPAQRVEDFLARRVTTSFGEICPSYQPGVTGSDLHQILPACLAENLRAGILGMDGQLKGFAHPDAVLTGVETRSSSPVRIQRDKNGMAAVQGVFPVGEGAGYAGGITSAAVDGIQAALQLLSCTADTSLV